MDIATSLMINLTLMSITGSLGLTTAFFFLTKWKTYEHTLDLEESPMLKMQSMKLESCFFPPTFSLLCLMLSLNYRKLHNLCTLFFIRTHEIPYKPKLGFQFKNSMNKSFGDSYKWNSRKPKFYFFNLKHF